MQRIKITSEIVGIFDLEPVLIEGGDAPDLSFRVELHACANKPNVIRARLWRKDFFRVQPTFPQAGGKPADEPADEEIFVEDTSFLEVTEFPASVDRQEVIGQILKMINAKLDLS
jgi:hypothetical protein